MTRGSGALLPSDAKRPLTRGALAVGAGVALLLRRVRVVPVVLRARDGFGPTGDAAAGGIAAVVA